MKRVLVLGCTGSIGTSTLDIVNNMPEDFSVCGLQAHSNKDKLEALAADYKCPTLLSSEDNSPEAFQKLIDEAKPDIVVNGIAGAAGLVPSKVVLENGIDLALANKETIVMAGPLIKELAKDKGAQLLPVDSEHSAIFNLTQRIGMKNISKIVITASGGPFRTYTKEQLESVTLEQRGWDRRGRDGCRLPLRECLRRHRHG
jgi:1-deoxy-D-xylulose-5-phosphate reductoisomerase